MTDRFASTQYVCDGTAALSPQDRCLVLLEGGRGTGRASVAGEKPAAARGLTFAQYAVFFAGCALVAALAVFASVAAESLHAAAVTDALARAPRQSVVVHSGDSLWSIAAQYGTSEVPVADVVSWMEDANDLEGGLVHEGQSVVVPVRAA